MAAMNRREFLLASAGLALAAACGGGDDDDDTVARVSTPDGGTAAAGTALNVVHVSYLHVAGIDQRVALGALNDDGTGPMALEGDIEVTIGGAPVEAALHARDGTPFPYLLVRHRFDAPGEVLAKLTMEGRAGEVKIAVKDPASVQLPFPGRPMIVTPSPTPANTLGVDPICTRKPVCPLHEVSLDAALAEKRPLAVLFSTPALCQSKFCGPVLENLLSQQAEFGDRVRFLHVDIYKDLSGKLDPAPTVRAYHLAQAGEPLLFLAGADGVVRDRIDNAFDRVEAKAALQQLVAG